MPKKTKQRQRQKQRQSLSNIIKIAIGNRKRASEKKERVVQPQTQRQPIIISPTPFIPSQPQQSGLYQNELLNSRLDLIQNRLENKVLEAVNKLQQPTFRTGSSMAGPTPESLFQPPPTMDEKPTAENLFGSDYVPPIYQRGGAYKPSPSLSQSSPLSSIMTESQLGGSAGGGGGIGSTASTKPLKYDTSPLGSLTPGTMVIKSNEQMRQFLKDNIDKIPLIQGETRKKPYTKSDIDALQSSRLQKIYESTSRVMKSKGK